MRRFWYRPAACILTLFVAVPATAQHLVTKIPVDQAPKGAAANVTTNKIYVSEESTSGAGEVAVIDGATNTVSSTLAVGMIPQGVAANPITNRIYVANGGDGTVSVIAGDTDTVIATVPVGLFPTAIAVNPRTNRIYVTNDDDDSISVISGARNQVMATIPGTVNPLSIGINPVWNLVYVGGVSGSNFQETLYVIDGNTNTVVASVPMPQQPAQPISLAVDWSLSRIYLTDAFTGQVNVVDASNLSLITTFSLPSAGALEVDISSHHLFAAGFLLDKTFASIDPHTFQVKRKISEGVHYRAGENALNSVTKLSYDPLYVENAVAVVSVP